MIVSLFNPAGSNLPKLAGKQYLEALRALINGQEELTSLILNQCRDTLLDGRHFTEFRDEDVQALFPDLTVARFNALYGDYGGAGHSPWVRQPALLAMIGGHLAKAGTPEDIAAFDAYLDANRDYFPSLPAPQLIKA